MRFAVLVSRQYIQQRERACSATRAFYEERAWGLAEQLDGTELPLIHYQLSVQTEGEEAFSRCKLGASQSLQVCV